MPSERYRHIFLNNLPVSKKFTSPSSVGPEKRIPDRDRNIHSQFLRQKMESAWQQAEDERAVVHATRQGVYIEFKSDPDCDLLTKSLEDMRSKKIRLLNVREELEGEQTVTYATVYVANEKKSHFLKKIQEYADAEKDSESGKPKNASFINSITDIRKALLVDSFWQDDKGLIPGEERVWCEVWLRRDEEAAVERFEQVLNSQSLRVANGTINFPERAVKVVYVNRQQLQQLTQISDDIAEYRRAKEASAFWLDMANQEQSDWVRDLLSRCRVSVDSPVALCVLDTGINNGHPLIAPVLKTADCHTINPAWGVDDHHGHGTLMAGVAIYGDLAVRLASQDVVHLNHSLESVKILPPGQGTNSQELWGDITDQAVSRAEIQEPEKKRVLCMAVTAPDARDRGRPSSWSGKLDQIVAGVDADQKRLFIVSAGNVQDFQIAAHYPYAQQSDSVHDPAQSWNALTIGAYTALADIKDRRFAGYMPIAPAGGLSPFTTTSLDWDNKWPIKPEIVLEGGNLVHDGNGTYDQSDELSVLSTSRDFTTRHFKSFNQTSAATAQAAWFAAQIYGYYPDAWPETVRALMVHSADWTAALKSQFLSASPNKTEYAKMMRLCGYGVPDMARAVYSAQNRLTLVAQAELQPYEKKETSGYRTKEMHLYELPWPKEVLLGLPPTIEVQMRVTLSYFIEPGPGEIGWRDRYRYASHGFRFDVKSPGETNTDFLKRINTAVRADEEGHPGTESVSSHWLIGANGRNKGSIHSDIWMGTAAELASSEAVAVYPIIGWWRERSYLGFAEKKARYSLVVSISTPEETVDIFTPVAVKVGITVPVTI